MAPGFRRLGLWGIWLGKKGCGAFVAHVWVPDLAFGCASRVRDDREARASRWFVAFSHLLVAAAPPPPPRFSLPPLTLYPAAAPHPNPLPAKGRGEGMKSTL